MRVFLSWSGEKSKMVAEALRDWLPDVVQAVVPWMSEEDIEKGAVGIQAIASELQDCQFGIICLTRENQERPWINYEAGALSKSVGDQKGRVATFLIDIERPSQVTGPVSSFQATVPTLQDVTRLVVDIDRATGSPRERERVARLVANLWPTLEEKIQAARELGDTPAPAARATEDVLAEILEISRQTARVISSDPSRLQLQDLLLSNRDRELGRQRNATFDAFRRDIVSILALENSQAEYSVEIDPDGFTINFQGHPLSREAIDAILHHGRQRGLNVKIVGAGPEDVRNYGFVHGIDGAVRDRPPEMQGMVATRADSVAGAHAPRSEA